MLPRSVCPVPAPPPTRGWTLHERLGAPLEDHLGSPAQARGSPAHAGMDLRRSRRWSSRSRLPRPRGDGPQALTQAADVTLAPPPTRGWTRIVLAAREVRRGSPAHAGMDPMGLTQLELAKRLPRPRGDGPSGSVRR